MLNSTIPFPDHFGGGGLWSDEQASRLNALRAVIILTTAHADVPIPWEFYEHLTQLNSLEFHALLGSFTSHRRRAFLSVYGRCFVHHMN